MKYLFIAITFSLFINFLNAQQETYPKGLYMNLDEVLEKSPSENFNIELEKRSKGKIKMVGGNDYQLNPIDKNVKKKFLRKDVYAYSDGTNLYINSFIHELFLWYSKVEADSNQYILFKAAIPQKPEDYGIESSNFPNMFGGIIGGISAAKRALIRLPYILDKENNKVILVSESNVRDFIGNSPELLSEFENEPDKNNSEVIFEYLSRWMKKKS